MSDGRLNFKATIDDTDFNRKLNNMEKGVDGLNFDAPTKSLDGLNKKLLETKQRLQESKNELKRLNAQISTTAPGAIQNNLLRERNALSRSINEDKAAIIGYKQEITNLNRELDNTVKKSRGLKGVFTTIASYFGVFAGIQTAISLIRGAFNTIVDFDSRLLNVSKTTGLAGQELKNLGASLRGLSQELKVISVDKLMEFAGVAGQLGIKGTQEILAFTEALAKLSVTSNIQGEEGAIQIARFLGLVDGNVKNVKDLGDELTNLGNNFKVFEDEIIKNALAIAQNTGTFKLGRQEILAYATSLKEAGVEAELTGASLGRTYQQIEKVLRTGKNIDNLAKITGQSVEDLKSSFDTDPQGVVYSFIKGLNEVQKAGGSVNNAITSIGITATRDLRVIGTLATGGFNVLNRAMNDVTDSSGAMQQEFETASGKISNSIESVKVSWENFILEINGSDNAIGNFLSGFMNMIATAIDGISRLSSSWDSLWGKTQTQDFQKGYESAMLNYTDYDKFENQRKKALQDRQKFLQEERRLQKDINELTQEYKEKSNKSIFGKAFTFGKSVNTLGSEIEKLNQNLNETRGRIKAIEDLENKINNKPTTNTTTTPLGFEDDKKTKKSESVLKKRLAFLDELQKAENDLTQTTLSGLDLELAKAEEVYQDRLKKAKELKANQDAINKIEELKTKETEIVTFKAETEALKISLAEQRKLYDDFENYKKQVGVDNAVKMYSDVIDTSKNYYDVLNEELSKADGERYVVLLKMLNDYGKEKTQSERKQMEDLFTMTMSFEQRILVLREKYAKLRAEAESKYSGEELKGILKGLEKQFKGEINNLSNEMTSQANNYANVTELIAGATRNQIESQIQSLQNFLNSTKDITDEQRNVIQEMINNLSKALPSAEGSSNGSAVSAVMREYNQISNEIERLKKLVSEKEKIAEFTEEVALLQSTIAGLESRKKDLSIDLLIASGDDISKLGDEFNKLSESIGGTNSLLGTFLSGLGSLAKNSGNIISAFGNISKALSNISSQGGLGSIFSKGAETGGLFAGIGAASSAVAPIIAGASVLFGIIDGISKKNKEEYANFKKWQDDVYRGELEYQDLLRKRRFDLAGDKDTIYDSVKSQIDELKNQIPELQKRYAEQLKQIQDGGTAIVDKYRKKDLFWSKTITDTITLKGATYEELEKLFLEGKLEGGTLAWFEALKKTKEELESMGLTLEDLEHQLAELTTGTSASQLSSIFADMFANGTNSAIEFGNVLEDVIKKAIVSGFKARFIDAEMEKLFDLLAGFSEDGLDQTEIDIFKMNAERVFELLNADWERIKDGLDLDFGGGDLGSGAKDGIKRITETQADRLTGILTGMQVDVIESRKSLQLSNNLLNSSLDNLVKIEYNTSRTYQGIERIESILQDNQNRSLGL